MESGHPPPSPQSPSGRARGARPTGDARGPHYVDLVATRMRDEHPERWTLRMTLGAREIDVGSFPTLGKAMITGARVYFESTLPAHLRRKYRHLLE
jgi:hypothetical protein